MLLLLTSVLCNEIGVLLLLLPHLKQIITIIFIDMSDAGRCKTRIRQLLLNVYTPDQVVSEFCFALL